MAVTFYASFFERALYPLQGSFHWQAYFGLALYLFLALALASILATLAYLFSLSSVQDSEKRSEYECGFEPFDSATRLPFDVHFYLVGILFLIFDVEIALLFPWVLALRTCGWFGFYLMIGFIILLAIGFLYEWKRGALIWPARQQEQTYFSFSTSNKVSYSMFLISFGDKLESLFEITNVSYFNELFYGMFPEFFLMTAIVVLLTYLALHIDKTNRFILAEKCLQYMIYIVTTVLFLYFFYFYFSVSRTLFNGYLAINDFVTLFKLFVTGSTLVILTNLRLYFKESNSPLIDFAIIFGLALLFILILISSAHIFTAFLSIVGFSLNLYILMFSEAKEKAAGREAGIKYFYLSTFSSGLLIYGFFLTFLCLGTGHLRKIEQILEVQPIIFSTGSAVINFSLLFMLIGLLFKLSAFPCHFWAADVYDGAPDPVVTFFMMPVKVGVLSFFIQLTFFTYSNAAFAWQNLIYISALGSLIWGCFASLFELKTKRFIAFSSINQMGFILTAIQTNSWFGVTSAVMYLFLYVVSNMILAIVFLNARRSDGLSLIFLTDFRKLAVENWAAFFSLAMSFFSSAGAPPLAGFFGKYFVFASVFSAAGAAAFRAFAHFSLVIAGLVTSLVSAFYYLRIIKIGWFENNVGVRDVRCILTSEQQRFLFFFEATLWSFIFVTADFYGFFNIALFGNAFLA